MNLSLLYNFFTGETSPLVEGRVDSTAQQMGAKRMENFIPMPTGGMRKRPGTVYDREIGTGENRYYIPITTENGVRYLMTIFINNAVTALWIDKKENGNYINVYYDNTNYNDIKADFTYCYEKNTVWILNNEDDLICYKLEWDGIALHKEAMPEFTGLYIIPKIACFYAGRLCMAGGFIKGSKEEKNYIGYMDYVNGYQYGDGSPLIINHQTPDNSIIKKVKKTITLTLGGGVNTTIGSLYAEVAIGMTGRNNICLNAGNYTATVIIEDYEIYDSIFYLLDNNFSPGTQGDHGLVSISIKVEIDYIIAGIHIKTNRIVLSKAPDSITGEDRYTNFELGAMDGDAIAIEEQDMYGSQIQWVFPHRRLLVATERALWSDTGEVPTPSTFDLNIIDYRGANSIRPVVLNNQVLYVSRDGNKIYSVVWVNTDMYGGYQVTDISENATHLFYGGIKSLATSNYPYTMLWVVTNEVDGKNNLICGVFNGGGYFFTRCNMPYVIDSVIVMNEEEGDVLCIVTKEGNTYNLEHLTLEDLVHSEWEDSHYVDSGEVYTGVATSVISIPELKRLVGKTVSVFADGVIHPPVEVEADGANNGKITLQYPASKVHIGLPIKSRYSPNTQQLPANGTSMGKKRRIDKILLKLYKTQGGKAGVTEEKATELITPRHKNYELGTAPDPFTGEIEVTVSGNIDTAGQLEIVHDDPAPFTLLALTQQVAILEA